eukprot:3193-Heterococcus_DN1.PRE.3
MSEMRVPYFVSMQYSTACCAYRRALAAKARHSVVCSTQKLVRLVVYAHQNTYACSAHRPCM